MRTRVAQRKTRVAGRIEAKNGSADNDQAIGAAPDALRMQRVVNFYEKLPRGPAPEVKATGILGRYQAKHFGKNPSAKRMSTFAPGFCAAPTVLSMVIC